MPEASVCDRVAMQQISWDNPSSVDGHSVSCEPCTFVLYIQPFPCLDTSYQPHLSLDFEPDPSLIIINE